MFVQLKKDYKLPAKSQQQQKFMGLVHAYKKGEVPASKVSKAVKDAAKSMSKKSVKKYAKTDHDDLPKKVKESKTSNMMKAIRKHGTAGPWSIIVSKNNKVVTRVSVKMLKEIPAYLISLRKKYPNHKFGIEAKSGRIAYREELGKLGKEQHLGWLKRQHKKYEDEIKRKIKALNGKGEKKMAIELMKLYKKHLIEFKIGLEKIYESVNEQSVKVEAISDKMSVIMTKLAKSLGIKSVVDMATGSGSLSYFLDDKMEAKKLSQMLKKTFKRVRLIPLDKSKGDTANFVVAADMIGL